jgi:hypothetical protein
MSGMFAGADEPLGGKGFFLPRLWPETSGRLGVPIGQEQKLDRRASGVKSPVKYRHLPFTRT